LGPAFGRKEKASAMRFQRRMHLPTTDPEQRRHRLQALLRKPSVRVSQSASA